MTIEEIVECDSKKLEGFTHAQLEEWFSSFFPQTRPELVREEQAKEKRLLGPNEGPKLIKTLSPQMQAALAEMAADGLDMSFINKKKKK